MENKKICVITTISGTMKAFLIDQLDYLSKNGFDVTIICDTDNELYNVLPPTIRYIPVSMKRGIDFLGMFKSIYKLYRIFKKEKFDIVQYSTPNAAFYASIAAWMARVHVRLYCQWGIRYVGFGGIKRKIFKIVEKSICLLSTYVEPDSKGNLWFSHNEGLYGPEKSGVVWNGSANGINLNKFNISYKEDWKTEIRGTYCINKGDFVFGFVGRLDKDKGVNELLASFKFLYEEDNGIWLMIVGGLDKKEGIKDELLEWANNCENVIFTGRTKYVEKYLAAMDIFILPSYREGFGSVVIEAEAMGVPVIVTDIPGPTDAISIGETGIVVPKGEVKPLIAAMKSLMNDNNKLLEMSERAVEFTRNNFDQRILWKHILEDRNRLIEKTIKKK